MEGFLDYKSDSKGYIYAKLYDCLVEGRLALEMMRKGLLQNASSKAFLSVKSAVSALVVKNLNEIVKLKDEREKYWYENVGYSAPTTGLIGISKDLKSLGIDAENVVRIALTLRRFSYNGFDPNFVDYRNPEEVVSDIKEVTEWLLNLKRYFDEFWDERLEKARKDLEELLKNTLS
ncbi:MAG: PaREP1 family protein [Sulfolobales archaeon]|nr:PaREP1 family protein [Sulfolobales archaeon]